HSAYHTPLDDKFRIQDSNDYFDSEAQRIENFQQILDKWFTRANKELYENVDSEIVKPQDPLATLEQDLAHNQISRSPRYMGHVVDHRPLALKQSLLLKRFTPFHLMRPHGSQKMCQSSDSVSVVRIPMKSSKSRVHPRGIQQLERNSYRIL
ncbi:unnamed protein product, partial [Pocillopora meandrina]